MVSVHISSLKICLFCFCTPSTHSPSFSHSPYEQQSTICSFSGSTSHRSSLRIPRICFCCPLVHSPSFFHGCSKQQSILSYSGTKSPVSSSTLKPVYIDRNPPGLHISSSSLHLESCSCVGCGTVSVSGSSGLGAIRFVESGGESWSSMKSFSSSSSSSPDNCLLASSMKASNVPCFCLIYTVARYINPPMMRKNTSIGVLYCN